MLKAVLELTIVFVVVGWVNKVKIFARDQIGRRQIESWQAIHIGILDQHRLFRIAIEIIAVFVSQIRRGILFSIGDRAARSKN